MVGSGAQISAVCVCVRGPVQGSGEAAGARDEMFVGTRLPYQGVKVQREFPLEGILDVSRAKKEMAGSGVQISAVCMCVCV